MAYHANLINETNPLVDPAKYHEEVTYRIKRTVYWTEPGLKITRLRLLGEKGYPAWDVSYVHGELDGEPVRVQVPFFQLDKRRWKSEIVEHAKEDGVFAKGLGIFEAVSTLS